MSKTTFISRITHGTGLATPGLSALTVAIRDNAPYLAMLLDRFPDIAGQLAEQGVGPVLDRLLAGVEALAPALPRSEFSQNLRQAKQQVHLCLALAELGQVQDCAWIMGFFSTFAQACIHASTRHALHRYGLDAEETGFFVIGFGKLAGGELNYSSDVDVAYFYDTAKVLELGLDPHKLVRVGREITALLSEVTAFGYGFRVDVRLRPDPASTPLVMGTDAALIYYESIGKTWERAAWIKARFLCGNAKSANEFLAQMQPFIWRRNRDYAAIDEIHRIRQLALDTKGQAQAGSPGYDVKTGAGGIREVELLAQTLQLIHGGRDPALRVGPSLQALSALSAAGQLTSGQVAQLGQGYYFLRTVEHALQMREDQQTHTMPSSPVIGAQIAALCGLPDLSALQEKLARTTAQILDIVHAVLPAPTVDHGQNPFIAKEEAVTIDWLQNAGFQDAASVLHVIRNWQSGQIRATRTPQAQDLLATVLPDMMREIARHDPPDPVFARAAGFLESLPAGVQLFSLLAHCPELVQRLVDVLGASPWMSQSLQKNPQLLESLLSTDVTAQAEIQWLQVELQKAGDLETAMNMARRQVQDARFRLGSRILRGHFQWQDISASLTGLAETAISGLADHVWRDMLTPDLAPVPWAVLGFGKLGSQEMGPTSDLDLVVVYADGTGADTRHIARFTRKLVSALSAPTETGELFAVDMDLRPSGRSGPVAVSLDAFCAYYRQDAWIWEYLALTRARVVAGTPGFAETVQSVLPELLRHCAVEKLRPDLRDMRTRLAEQKPQRHFWDLKRGPGGMMDLDFITQVQMILAGQNEPVPVPHLPDIAEIHSLYHVLSQILAVTLGQNDGQMLPDAPVISLLMAATDAPDLAYLQDRLSTARARIAHVLQEYCG